MVKAPIFIYIYIYVFFSLIRGFVPGRYGPCGGSLLAEGREWEGSVGKGGDGVVRSPRLWRQPLIEGTRNWKVSAAAYREGIAPGSVWWTRWKPQKTNWESDWLGHRN